MPGSAARIANSHHATQEEFIWACADASNVVEHPDLVADRIGRFAGLVGRERVLASTDCGLSGRIHPQIAWAKLETLAEGAARTTQRLWRSAAA